MELPLRSFLSVTLSSIQYGGKYVVNPSGGLEAKGHPLGATGLAMHFYITSELSCPFFFPRSQLTKSWYPQCNFANVNVNSFPGSLF